MKIKLEWKSCLRAGAVLFGLYLLVFYWEKVSDLIWTGLRAAVPLALGCIIAYVVNIPMGFFERHLGKRFPEGGRRFLRPLCLLLSVVSLFALVTVIVQMILPELISCVTLLLERLPLALNALTLELERNFHISEWVTGEADAFFNGTADWRSLIQQVVDWLVAGFGGAMESLTSVVSSMVNGVITLLVGAIFSIYVLMGKEQLSRQLQRLMATYLGRRVEEKALYLLTALDTAFHRFIVGQCVEAVILGMLCIVGMLLFRFPYAGMIGALIGFTALIPIAGAYIGAVVGALMIFTVSPLKALLFLVFLVVLQQLEGNLIYPRVVGSSIGLPGIWVLVAVTVGGGLLGVGGMLLGVPLTAAAYQLLRRDMEKRPLPAAQED